MKFTIILLSAILIAASGCLSPEMRSAKIALNEKEYLRAIENLDKEIDRMPGNAEVWYLKGFSYEKLSDWVSMSESYSKSIELSDQFQEEIDQSISRLVSRYYKRSLNYLDSSNWDSAQVFLDTAIIVDNANYRLYRQAAITAYRGDKNELAINYCLTAIDNEPTISEAREEFENNESINSPDYNMESRKVLLAIYGAEKNWNKVIEWSKKIMDRVDQTEGEASDYLSGLDELISAYEVLENNEEAELAITKAMQKFPDNLQLSLNLATYKIRRDDNQGAMEVLKTVLAINPENIFANLTIGTIMIMDKKYKESIPYLEAVIAIEPENKNALQNLVSAYYNTDQIEKGSEVRKRWEKLR